MDQIARVSGPGLEAVMLRDFPEPSASMRRMSKLLMVCGGADVCSDAAICFPLGEML